MGRPPIIDLSAGCKGCGVSLVHANTKERDIPEGHVRHRKGGKCRRCVKDYGPADKTYREPITPGVLPDTIRAMIRDRQRRGIPAEGVLFEGETAA